MSPAELQHLQSVDLTVTEKKAVLALLRSSMTLGVVSKLGLDSLLIRLEGQSGEGYDGPWEYNGLPKAPTVKDYGVADGYDNQIR